jgi:hypothetical protein
MYFLVFECGIMGFLTSCHVPCFTKPRAETARSFCGTALAQNGNSLDTKHGTAQTIHVNSLWICICQLIGVILCDYHDFWFRHAIFIFRVRMVLGLQQMAGRLSHRGEQNPIARWESAGLISFERQQHGRPIMPAPGS